MKKKSVAILGATGTVGQKMITMLDNHPLFEITQLVASEKSTGKTYAQAVSWRERRACPENIKNLTLIPFEEVSTEYALSSLPSDEAKIWELTLAKKGIHVISNASSNRMVENIPLIIPEINKNHMELIHAQNTTGKIITNPNCSTVFLCMAIAPLMEISKIKSIHVVTMQAISGAGYPGVASLDILGNLRTTIDSEEEKMETEPQKILKSYGQNFSVTAQCNRVAVPNGHTLAMEIIFEKAPTPTEVLNAYKLWNERHGDLFNLDHLERGPEPRYLEDEDQRTFIGKIQQKNTNSIQLISMGHNLVRGAAGAAILNLEAMNTYLKGN